jgi:hypothetical protein
VTRPSVETTQSGDTADAVRTLQSELSNDYSEIRSAEIQLTEAILTAHAVTVSGRDRLQDIQRQLIEAINNPVTALDTPAGERQFLLFLRSKVAEIADIVETGALTDEDHARVTRALGSGYLLTGPGRDEPPSPPAASSGAPTADPAAGLMPAIGSALGALPQAAQGAAAAPAQGASGLVGAASPLAGMASGLLERSEEAGLPRDQDAHEPDSDEPADVDEESGAESEADADTGDDTEDDTEDGSPEPRPPGDREPPDDSPAQTRPALLQEHM